MTSTPRLIGGLGEIASAYDAFILDLWGCLHDGVTIYPAAFDCLRQLKAAGKIVVILSNAPRRAREAEARLNEMGVGRDLYAALYCSGEETFRAITANQIPALQGRGNKVFAIMARRDRAMVDDAHLIEASPAEADFVLAIGKETTQITVAEFLPDLRVALARGLPMVCANPDLMVHRGGVEEICAGAIALAYQEMGGEVIWFGKPYPGVYRRILAEIGVPTGRVLCVGDSFRTDVAGGRNIGAATLLTVGGIHHAEILVENSIDLARLLDLCRKLGPAPDYAIAHLGW